MNKKIIKRIIKFCLSGGVGVGLYYITLYCLIEFMNVWYVASAVIAFVINQVANFILQKLWTFENADTKAVHIQAVRYISMALSFLILNTASLYVLVDLIHVPLYVAQVLLTFILSVLSYFITAKIFKK